MIRITRLSIRSQLLLIVLIAALPAALFIVSSALDQRARAFRDAREDMGKLASIIASEQGYRVAAAQQLLMMLGQLPDVKRHRPDSITPLLVAIHNLQTQYSNIFIADRHGKVWASALPSQNVTLADRRYFRSAMEAQRLSSGEYMVSKFTKKLAIVFGYPYTDEHGNAAGVICLGFDLDFYKRLLNTDELKEGKSYLLLDYKGVVLARPIDPAAFVGKPYNKEQFKRMQQGPDEDTVIEQGMDGKERLIAYRKMRLESEGTPYLYIRAGIPTATILAHAKRQLLVNVGFFALFLLLTLSVAWFIGKRSIADPVALLESASRRMAEGDLQARIAGGIKAGELGSLGRTFDHMAEQLVARETERTKLIGDLQQALGDIRTLHGIIPICSSCKKIRNEEGDWTQLEAYISKHTNAEFSHGICAECAKKLYGNLLDKKK